MARRTKQYICVTQFDHYVSFALIKDGKCAFAQFRNNDVPDPVDGVWWVRDGAQPMHTSVRMANPVETVNVDGTRYTPKLYNILNALIASGEVMKAA